jgi:hypothetical protein
MGDEEESSVEISFSSTCAGRFVFSLSATEMVMSTGRTLSRDLLWPNGVQLSVLAARAVVPSPRLLWAAFVGSGEEVELRFDSHTDMAGREAGARFSCQALLRLAAAPTPPSSCFWEDSTRLKVLLGRSSAVRVGHGVSLLDGQIASRDSSASLVAAVNLTITSRLTRAPKLRVTAPAVTSAAAPLRLDLRASSGAGGCPWRNITLNVTGLAHNLAAVNNFYYQLQLQEQNSLLNSLLPAGFLLAGEFYIFDFSACTFMGACVGVSHKVQVREALLLPIVVAGPAFKTVLRSEAVSLRVEPELEGSAYSSAYDFLMRFLPEYTLEVFAESPRYAHEPLFTANAAGRAAPSFSLPAYLLSPGSVLRVA